MDSNPSVVQAAEDAINEAVGEAFRSASSATRLKVAKHRPSVLWHDGLLVAAVSVDGGSKDGAKDGATAVALLHISTRGDSRRPVFLTDDRMAIGAGDYVIETARDNSVQLRPAGGGGPVVVAGPITIAQDSDPNKPDYCKGPEPIRTYLKHQPNGTVCIIRECPGVWVRQIACLNLVDFLGGLVGGVIGVLTSW